MNVASAKIVWSRVIRGYLIAPLVVPLAYFVVAALTGRNYGVSELVGTVLNYGAYTYVFALLLGVPAFWVLRRSGHAGLWSYALSAAAIGFLGASLFSLIGLKVEGVLIGTLTGALAGVVFYLIATP